MHTGRGNTSVSETHLKLDAAASLQDRAVRRQDWFHPNRVGFLEKCGGHSAPPARRHRVALAAGVPARGHHLAPRPELAAQGERARLLAARMPAGGYPDERRVAGTGAPVVAGELAEPELVARHALVEARVEAGRPPALVLVLLLRRRPSARGRGRHGDRDHDGDGEERGHASADPHCLQLVDGLLIDEPGSWVFGFLYRPVARDGLQRGCDARGHGGGGGV